MTADTVELPHPRDPDRSLASVRAKRRQDLLKPAFDYIRWRPGRESRGRAEAGNKAERGTWEHSSAGLQSSRPRKDKTRLARGQVEKVEVEPEALGEAELAV